MTDMSPIPRNTCSRQCVQFVGGLFVGEYSSLRVFDHARLELDKVVPSESGFVLETMTRLLQYWNVTGTRFDQMPETPTYDGEWEAYEEAARKVVSVPDRVVDFIKTATIYNSCTNAIERRSNAIGYPSGMRDIANALVYKSFESVGDSYEDNYSNCCMILHGFDEDDFSFGCAVLVAVWNSLDSFSDGPSTLYRHMISTSMSGNLSIPRYCAKEQLANCKTMGEWGMGIKTTAIEIVKHMTGVSTSWPEHVAITTVRDATVADYHRMAVDALYKTSNEHVINMCVEWANEIINATLIRDMTVNPSMTLSARDALLLARTNSNAAQGDRAAKDSAIRHYQAANSALAIGKAVETVNAVKTANASLEATIAAQQDRAMESEKSDGSLKRKAFFKCRERTKALRQQFNGKVKASAAAVVLSSGGPLPAPAMATPRARVNRLKPLPGVSSLSNCTASTTTFVSTSSTPSVNTPPATAGNITSTTQLMAPHTPQVVALASVASGKRGSPTFFSKDVSPVPYIYQLPGPNAELQTTCQLAYCLALLHASVHENDLSSDARDWRLNTLSNLHEKNRLETLAVRVIEAFAKDAMKNVAAVTEVVELAPVLSNEDSWFLLKTFFDTVNQSEMPQLHLLSGLAKAIQGAAPGFVIHSDNLVVILGSLHRRLQNPHSDHSDSHRYHVLLAVSRVLDAMVDAKVEKVDSSLHGPLTDRLRELEESSRNPYLTFQASYATQALLNVSSNENVFQAGLRRGLLVLKGGAGFAKMPDLSEMKGAVEGLETLYDALKGGARIFMDALEAIKTRECPTLTIENGLQFKKAWYSALRIAELYIQAGKLVQFETFLATLSKTCRCHPMFQWGICQLLGQFATDTQWDLEARRDAIAFLGELYRINRSLLRPKNIGQVIFDVLTKVVTDDGPRFEIARTLLEEMRQQSTQPWHNILPSDLAVHDTTSNVTLLQIVQNRLSRHARLEALPDRPPQPKLEDIQLALKTYYARKLHILRVSGEPLDLETCFVNLAIVEAPAQREKETQYLKEQAAVFHRITSFERLEHTNTLSPIPLERLFDKRKLRDGKEDHPKRILVQGRAGIGKTTLSKKIVHAHQRGLWRDRFDTVLWLPLRHLKALKVDNLEGLFRKKFFTQDLDEEGAALARALVLSVQQGRVLFILDGLDEIAKDTQCDDGLALKEFLMTLLAQQHVVITSRPSGVDRSLIPTIDLELETIGFSPQNVSDYLVKVLEPDQARTVQDFIGQTPLMQGLVNIPVQLDVICFSWDSLPTDGPAITMTGPTHEIDDLMATEMQHLGYLAFKGLTNDHQIEFEEDALLSAFRDLQKDCQFVPPQVLEMMQQTSFLHSADVGLDVEHGHSQPTSTWHFLHLTFQEYFAATWIARHLQPEPPQSNAGMMTVEQMASFIQKQKYNPQYEIVWWMVAGLLEGKALGDFFSLLQGAPRDLIGSRHQQILASCLHEARARLDPAVVVTLDSELLRWLRFEMEMTVRLVDTFKPRTVCVWQGHDALLLPPENLRQDIPDFRVGDTIEVRDQLRLEAKINQRNGKAELEVSFVVQQARVQEY
ncbi:hypothetical protein KVV02_002865 [Mortierella alpina]|uniref:NACHT domain-containing protein n=1 Tax=Mortierella alpina TaxID=64518 RepID=A0A9P7ZX78_MORAP|nr:hypothetical protein KVV02_002865 [Mortierella alpina]